MSQYFPAHKAVDDPVLNRRISKREFDEAEEALHKWKLDNGWIQRI
jgi:putative pyruvate formate lyase activating enzyme